MDIMSSDGKKIVDVGTFKNWNALYSTAWTGLKKERKQYKEAFLFLKTGECSAEKIELVRSEVDIIRSKLKEMDVSKAVYDYKNIHKKGDWYENTADSIETCADLFTTSEGKNLLDELLTLLKYCEDNKVSIILP